MKNYKKIWNVVLVVALALIAGCDDGQLRFDQASFSVSPPSPFIVSFQASPSKIKQGESTVITWEVANADSVEITSRSADGSSPVHVESKELTGSVAVNNLATNTDLTLVAKLSTATDETAPALEGSDAKALSISAKISAEDSGEEEKPIADESGAATAPVPASATITVEVTPVEKLTATVTADSPEVSRNANTIIRWTVTPADATVAVTDSDSNPVSPVFAGEDCKKTDAADLLATGTPTEAPAANGCAVVTVLGTTVYTVTATDKEGANAIADVKIEVPEVKVTAEIAVNGELLSVLPNFQTPVDVSWKVSPADSVVTVTAEPAATCTPALPQGQAVDYASSKCTITASTQFKVRAELPGDAASFAEAVARVERGNVTASAEVDVRADEWAFEGEEVAVEVSAKAGSDASAIKEVAISDVNSADGFKRVTLPIATPVTVKVPRDGVKVTVEDVSGGKKEQTAVRTLATIENAVTAEEVTALSFASDDPKTRFYGVRMAGYNKGMTKLYINGADKALPFGEKLKAATGLAKYWVDESFDASVKTFPVNTVVSRPGNASEIYAGLTGAIMYTKDGGAAWDVALPALRISKDGKDYQGSHPSCRGLEQTGVKAHFKKQLVSLNQICDLQVTTSGRMVIGSDLGAFVVESIDDYIAKAGKGVTILGKEEGAATYGHVVDDVECVDEECGTIFAAASDLGVMQSTDGGKTWAAFGALAARAYKLTIVGTEIYASTDAGVFKAGIADPNWVDLKLGKEVKSIAVDKNLNKFGGRMIIAGTPAGAFVTRDTGAKWSPIASLGEAGTNNVAISTGDAVGGGSIVTILVSGEKKVTYGQTLVDKVVTAATPEETTQALVEAGLDQDIVNAYMK